MIKLRMTIGMMLALILSVAIGTIAVASTNSIIKDSVTPYQTQPKDCRYNPKDC